MNKKLKIQFWKAEKAFAMQILEQEGLPKYKNDGFVKIGHSPSLDLEEMWLRGSEVIYNAYIDSVYFKSNSERDAFLQKAINAITDELFTEGGGELKVGELCEVRDYDDESWRKRKLITILPEQQSYRFVVETLEPHRYVGCEYVRPLTKCTEPTVEKCGQLVTYTWEEK